MMGPLFPGTETCFSAQKLLKEADGKHFSACPFPGQNIIKTKIFHFCDTIDAAKYLQPCLKNLGIR